MKRAMILTLLILILLLSAGSAWAQDGYDLDWWTVDGGGVTSPSGTGYSLSGTIGQPDAAVWNDGGYSLSGGFWFTGPALVGYQVFLPVVVRGGP